MAQSRRHDAGDVLRHQMLTTVMLNTLATLRKRRYQVNSRDVSLNLNKSMQTIVYNHQSILERKGKMPLKGNAPPYSKTRVLVVKDDCVGEYANLIKSGRRPVLLNMANATNPGGGYRKGDGAQEETLFRRSDYCRSLDVDLDDFIGDRAPRFFCSPDCQNTPLTSSTAAMYPMDEYGCIYSTGLTFFRQPQETGYEYMETPLENVAAIAMAAYRDPKLDGDMLSPKYAVGMRKKMENIFAIAQHHKNDSMVLSAFGCGAFRNPPEHVARLFQSVIEQYAGFFDSIIFAIIDDHNTGSSLNPGGNYKPFADLLDGRYFEAARSISTANAMLGPYRLLDDADTVNEVAICALVPCQFGARCRSLTDSKHTDQYSHPSVCLETVVSNKCDRLSDVVHTTSFLHRNQCRYGGECRQIDDPKHAAEYDHPSSCPQRGECQNMDDNHLKQYRHVPLCSYGQKCIEYLKKVKEHRLAKRHCRARCADGNHCVKIHDRDHMSEFDHPFPTPCSRTPFHCPQYIILSEAADMKSVPIDVQQHCLSFAHVCRFGRNCAEKNALHWENSIHIARQLCPHGDKCGKLAEEDHLNSFTHGNIVDIRRLCKFGERCHERRQRDHMIKFRHPALLYGDTGVVRFSDLNKDINFVKNQLGNVARVKAYVKAHGWKSSSDGIPSVILNWVRTVQPVHRCNLVIFESILLHGHVMSRDHMDNLRKPKFVAQAVMDHSRICRIKNLHIPQIEHTARDYILALVLFEFSKCPNPKLKSVADSMMGGAGGADVDAVTSPKTFKKNEQQLSSAIPEDFDAVKTKAIEIARASIELSSNPAGIGYDKDKALGTDKHIFSVLGPHYGHYYGDIIILFKREILHHPDTDFALQAATSYASGHCYNWRPWLGTDPGTLDSRVAFYHQTKLHASVPGYDYVLALELMAVTSHTLKAQSMDIDLPAVLKRWSSVDSHMTVEAHLPPLIPLDYIDHIYIPKNLHASLSNNARRSLDAVFKNRFTVTPHDGLAQQPAEPWGPVPNEQSRVQHQASVVEDLRKRYEENMRFDLSRRIQGAVITIPGEEFRESFAIPLTISQAHEQFRIEHPKAPATNIVFVYWQAMQGDMMLVLSNERIDASEHQPNLRCLLCYIASQRTIIESEYGEQTTYLNVGKPLQHHLFVDSKKYLAKSNTFHAGCNVDDYITYCLELNRSTGQVILRHAGSNAIYNHEELSCTLTKSDVDLNKLEYIQVTAGVRAVPVRNLMVYFEKQDYLHPTYDKEFKAKIPKPAGDITDSGAPKDDRVRRASKDKGAPSSKLSPCPDNVNCLQQYASDSDKHNAKFSHPCRFAELCRKKEAHLTHDAHPCSLCHEDGKCEKVIDPHHRAKYRHRGLPDYLVPCRLQSKCKDNSPVHRTKYSHGEQVYETDSGATGGSKMLCERVD